MADKNQNPEMNFVIQRIYVKDASFEAPHAPQIFKEEWKPEVNVDLQTKTQSLEEGIYEVVLHLTVTVKMGDKTAFLVEAHQGGIFTIKGFPQDQINQALGAMCPTILYPYARETISSLVTGGGFPQLLLAPVNFDALYLAHQKQEQEKSKK